MWAKSTKSIHFPSLNWGITAGVPTKLPSEPNAQKIIIAHKHIKRVSEPKDGN